ncbi:hypothetical protein BDV59DRAFT_211090 [Aspergillus ambiguus]|uniref:uncharacterized protein n=1 Tax=Aspergillus ambiguus TaxID=176160 RepID=UPI003CCD7909
MAQQRLRMSDVFPDPNEDRSLVILDEATRTLYRRAIDNPSSLTDEERRIVTHRPPGPEEDEQCQQACGLTFTELVRKAIDQRDSLSYHEAVLLLGELIPGEAGQWLRYRLRLSEADQDLLHTAIDTAWTEEMREARANAHAVQTRGLQASSAAAKFLNDDDIRHIRLAMMVPWQEQVLSVIESEVCGLVGFYRDREDWAAFREQIETAVHHGLHYRAGRVKNEAIAKFTLHWVPIDDPFSRDLRDLFAEKRDQSEFPRGLRTDSFLFVDQEALQSRDSKRPFVWLWEPNQEKDDEKEEEEIDLDPLKIDIKHIAPTLFAQARRKPYRFASKLKALHRVTKYSQNPTTREYDWIWPPPARFM